MIYALFLIFLIIMVLDSVTTIKGLENEDNSEGNGTVAWVMEKIGVVPTIILADAIQLSLIVPIVIWYPAMWWILLPPIAWRGYVVFQNFRVLSDSD